ncbi:hypothetical protein BS47DRAFT_146086 [Hydnum rufescens UP504]|uniref:Uncharacterized protein n=1 Tax=Hydnum rufescens UP504 TaxID=1448309 RepID=A0A9P6DTD7_9AGAM|nr:hypothetical protein BS47DRAFT_146086 [Hydnum rufescens UP504]
MPCWTDPLGNNIRSRNPGPGSVPHMDHRPERIHFAWGVFMALIFCLRILQTTEGLKRELTAFRRRRTRFENHGLTGVYKGAGTGFAFRSWRIMTKHPWRLRHPDDRQTGCHHPSAALPHSRRLQASAHSPPNSSRSIASLPSPPSSPRLRKRDVGSTGPDCSYLLDIRTLATWKY